MNEFWAYEDWPTAHARIHRSDCGFCKQGNGLNGGGDGHNCAWYGPYSSVDEARAACRRFTPRGCYWCLPQVR
jgi:hypothetical protein